MALLPGELAATLSTKTLGTPMLPWRDLDLLDLESVLRLARQGGSDFHIRLASFHRSPRLAVGYLRQRYLNLRSRVICCDRSMRGLS